jgi:tetratricopeptide (TPR) repeat protein
MGLFTAWFERTMVFALDQTKLVLSIVERCLIPGRALWFYLGKLAWPHPLVFIYPRWEVSGAVWWQWMFPVAALLLAAGLWRMRGRLGTGPLVGLLYFAGTLFPALGFFDAYFFRFSLVADHFQYLACLGPLALAGAGLELGLSRLAGRTPLVKPVCCAGVLTILGALTWVQCAQYADAETLWRATLARNPHCWLAHNDLGVLSAAGGKPDEAAAEFKMYLDANPGDALAHYNLGSVLIHHGEVAEGIAQLRVAIAIQPAYPEAFYNLGNALSQKGDIPDAIAQFRIALSLRPDYPEALNNLGIALFNQGDVAQAIGQFQKTLALHPDFLPARASLGCVLLRKGDFDGAMDCFEKTTVLPSDPAQKWYHLGNNLLKEHVTEAIACYRQALAFNPRSAEACAALGMACYQNGQFKEAAVSWQKSLDLNPAQPLILNNLASLLATASDASLRDGPRAVALAEQASQLAGGTNPMVLCTLAAAWAEAGHYDQASTVARKALELARSQKNENLAAALQHQIQLYQAGHPLLPAQ